MNPDLLVEESYNWQHARDFVHTHYVVYSAQFIRPRQLIYSGDTRAHETFACFQSCGTVVNAWSHAKQHGGIVWMEPPPFPLPLTDILFLASSLSRNLLIATWRSRIVMIACKEESHYLEAIPVDLDSFVRSCKPSIQVIVVPLECIRAAP